MGTLEFSLTPLSLTYCLTFVLRSCRLYLPSLCTSTPTPCLRGCFFLLARLQWLPHRSRCLPLAPTDCFQQSKCPSLSQISPSSQSASMPHLPPCCTLHSGSPTPPLRHSSSSVGLRDLWDLQVQACLVVSAPCSLLWSSSLRHPASSSSSSSAPSTSSDSLFPGRLPCLAHFKITPGPPNYLSPFLLCCGFSHFAFYFLPMFYLFTLFDSVLTRMQFSSMKERIAICDVYGCISSAYNSV